MQDDVPSSKTNQNNQTPEREIGMLRVRVVLPIVVLLLMALFFSPTTTFANDAVVGTGSPASCTEIAFDSALNTVQTTGGGTITFNCGGSATIVFSGYKQISSNVTINGGGTITLDGNNLTSFFQVFNSASLQLNDLTLRRGSFNGIHPLDNFGSLTLDSVTLSQSVSNGSPIENIGTLTIRDSAFSDNGLTGNGETDGGVIHNDGGTLTIQNSTFNNNIVNGNVGTGGAIAVVNGTATITDSTFANNRALDGGAIYLGTGGSATIEESTFSANVGGNGGAIESNGMNLTVERTLFAGNQAVIGDGGAIRLYNGTLNTIQDSEFTNNHSVTSGGALSCLATGLSISGTTFAFNQATDDNNPVNNGGGIFSSCTINVTNSTFSGNQAENGGGAFYQQGSRAATLSYVTITENSAVFGAGINNDGTGTSTLTISKSIVAYNETGNCAGVIASGGYNFSNNTYCSAFTETGDVQNATIPLLPLGMYGGLTETHPPAPDSPVIDHIPAGQCSIPVDQRGVERPSGSACDSGAVEGTVYQTFLSLTQRN
jgi:hypothetical protein